MNSYLPKFRSLRVGWNKRALTERDFYALCKRFKISVEDGMALSVFGFYHRLKGKNHIALSSKMNGLKALFIMFHELGHFLMHAPGTESVSMYCTSTDDSREEQEANAFAYCCILPLTELMSTDPEELAQLYGLPLCEQRWKVYDRYAC